MMDVETCQCCVEYYFLFVFLTFLIKFLQKIYWTLFVESYTIIETDNTRSIIISIITTFSFNFYLTGQLLGGINESDTAAYCDR